MDCFSEKNQNNLKQILIGLFKSIECKSKQTCICEDQSQCFDRCNLLSHIRNCDSYNHCSYPRCLTTTAVMKHFINCRQPRCVCSGFGQLANSFFCVTIKDILLKNQFLVWRRKITPFRRNLVLMITRYLIGFCEDNKNEVAGNIVKYLINFENEQFSICTGISAYLSFISEKCNLFLTQILIEKQLKYNIQYPGGIDKEENLRNIYEILRQYSTDVLYDKLTLKDEGNCEINGGQLSHTVDQKENQINFQNDRSTLCMKQESQENNTFKTEYPDYGSVKQECLENTAVKDQKKEDEVEGCSAALLNIKESSELEKEQLKKVQVKQEPVESGQLPNEFCSIKAAESPSNSSSLTPPKSFPSIKGSPESSCMSLSTEFVKTWSKTEILDIFLPIHKRLVDDKDSEAFLYPVDWKALALLDYPTIILQPMDLSTIRTKLSSGTYTQPWRVIDDFWLMFNNAWLYNKKSSRVYKSCTNLVKVFETLVDDAMRSVGFCCGRDFIFLPQVLICCTPKMCNINRDAVYHCINNDDEAEGGRLVPNLANDKYVCCDKCFNESSQDESVELMVSDSVSTLVKVEKSLFTKLKNSTKEKEEFVECRRCRRQWHRICAGHVDEIWRSGFFCKCCDEFRDHPKQENTFTAANLPHTELSRHIETQLDLWRQRQKENVPKIIIRVLSVSDKSVEIRPEMKRTFVDTGEMADGLPYRLKATFAFQQQKDGSEVCLFGMHTQEFSSDCPDPNSRRVYLAYLDSVHYFEPRALRTDFYHRMLISYFDYCRKLGFVFAHIWACPPGEGDDYIFHMHPPNQKLPKPKRLQDWYIAMLDQAMKEGCIVDYHDIFSYAFNSQLSSVPELPYFEGDYWPTILEDFLKEDCHGIDHILSLNNDEDDKFGSKDPVEVVEYSNSKKRKLKKIPTNAKRKKNGDTGEGSSDLTRRLFDLIERHKENFFVVRFHNPGEASLLPAIEDKDPLGFSELMDGRDRFLSLSREKHLEFSSLRRATFSTAVLCYELHLELRQGVIYSCNLCDVLLDNVRYTCESCEEFELCETCAKTKKHPHDLQRFPRVESLASSKTTPGTEDSLVPKTGASTVEVSKTDNIRKAVIVFDHASLCRDANCRVNSCTYMKTIVRHRETCPIGVNKDCNKCKLVVKLQMMHVRVCVDQNCHIGFCMNKRRGSNAVSNTQNRLIRMAMERRRMDAAMSTTMTNTTNGTQAGQMRTTTYGTAMNMNTCTSTTSHPGPQTISFRNPYQNEIDIIHKYVGQWQREPGMTQERLKAQVQQLLKSDIRYQEAYTIYFANKQQQQLQQQRLQQQMMVVPGAPIHGAGSTTMVTYQSRAPINHMYQQQPQIQGQTQTQIQYMQPQSQVQQQYMQPMFQNQPTQRLIFVQPPPHHNPPSQAMYYPPQFSSSNSSSSSGVPPHYTSSSFKPGSRG